MAVAGRYRPSIPTQTLYKFRVCTIMCSLKRSLYGAVCAGKQVSEIYHRPYISYRQATCLVAFLPEAIQYGPRQISL